MSILNELTSQAEQAEVVEISAEVTVVGYESNRLKSSRVEQTSGCLLYTSPSPRDRTRSRMPSSA